MVSKGNHPKMALIHVAAAGVWLGVRKRSGVALVMKYYDWPQIQLFCSWNLQQLDLIQSNQVQVPAHQKTMTSPFFPVKLGWLKLWASGQWTQKFGWWNCRRLISRECEDLWTWKFSESFSIWIILLQDYHVYAYIISVYIYIVYIYNIIYIYNIYSI